MADIIGFIGLGVMGGPMCRNIATKHPGRVLCFDLSDAARAALEDTKAEQVDSVEALAKEADIICMSLPGGPQVLRLDTRAVPEPGAGEVLIKVHAAGVMRAPMPRGLRPESAGPTVA